MSFITTDNWVFVILVTISVVIVILAIVLKVMGADRDPLVEHELEAERQRAIRERSARGDQTENAPRKWQEQFDQAKRTVRNEIVESIEQRLRNAGVLTPEAPLPEGKRQWIEREFNAEFPWNIENRDNAWRLEGEAAFARFIDWTRSSPPRNPREPLGADRWTKHGREAFLDKWTKQLSAQLRGKHPEVLNRAADLPGAIVAGEEQARTARNQEEKDNQLRQIEAAQTQLIQQIATGLTAQQQAQAEQLAWLEGDVNAIDPADPAAAAQLAQTRARLDALSQISTQQNQTLAEGFAASPEPAGRTPSSEEEEEQKVDELRKDWQRDPRSTERRQFMEPD